MENPRVTTDRTIDTYSLDTIVAGVVRPGMSDEEKATALWRWFRQTVYHYGWPYMRPQREETWQDPVKAINVHGYSLCGSQARVLGRLFGRVFGEGNTRLIGLTEVEPGAWRLREGAGAFVDTVLLRDWDRIRLAGHTSVEVRYGGRWRLLDPEVGFVAYLKHGEGIAGAEDMIADPFLVTEPVRHTDGLMPCGDLSRVFYASVFRDWGLLERKDAPDDHSMQITLRRGETYTRHWDRKGPFHWFKEMDRRWDPEYLSPGPRHICEGDTPWRHYGNGELIYRPRLADGSYRDGVMEEDSIRATAQGGLVPLAAGRRSRVVFTVRVPYLLVKSHLSFGITRRTGSDKVEVRVRRPGAAWRVVWREPDCGFVTRRIELSPWTAGTYGYDVRLDVRGTRRAEHASIRDLALQSEFVLNYLALPRLLPGRNRVTVTTDHPAELARQKLAVTYAWSDCEGEHEHRRTILASPQTYEIEVAPVATYPPENPKYMRFIRMEVE